MKKIITNLPIVSALLLFVGYLNYTTYYRLFDIEITSYLTTGELLLSFLPLTSGILIALFFFIVLFISVIIAPPKENESKSIDRDNNISLLSIFLITEFFKNLRVILNNKLWKNFRQILNLIFNVLFLLVGLSIILFFILFFIIMSGLVIDHKLFPDFEYSSIFWLSFLWFLLMLDVVKKRQRSHSLKYIDEMYLILVTIAFLYFTTISNKKSATDVLSGKPHFSAKLSFSDSAKNIVTDSNLVFIGKTANYFFFRNLEAKTNIIYNSDGVVKIDIQKNRYSKK